MFQTKIHKIVNSSFVISVAFLRLTGRYFATKPVEGIEFMEGLSSDDEIRTSEGSDSVVLSLGDDTINLGENGSSGNWWSDRDIVEGSGHSNVFKLSAGTYVKGYSVTCNGNGSTPKIRTARFL